MASEQGNGQVMRQELPADLVQVLRGYEDEAFLNSLYSPEQVNEWCSVNAIAAVRDFVKEHPLDKLLSEGRPSAEIKLPLPELLIPFLTHIGQQIQSPHRFEKKGSLGRGAFGQVFKGTCRVYNVIKEVVVKKPLDDKDQELDKELAVLKKAKHLFVVEFLGTMHIDKAKCIVLELCTGDLSKYIKSATAEQVAANGRVILAQVVLGLNYLHNEDIVHADLRPDNILYKQTDSGIPHIKLADFGNFYAVKEKSPSYQFICYPNRASEHERLTAREAINEAVTGTAPIANDEQITHEPEGCFPPELMETRKPTLESDVWALGVVVFFVVTKGQHPYALIKPAEFLDYVAKKVRNPPKVDMAYGKNWAAADLLCRLLQHEPSKRPHVSSLLLHPYFSTADESTKTYLAARINDFFTCFRDTEAAAQFKRRFNESDLQRWYDHLEEALKSDEDEESLKQLRKRVKDLDTRIGHKTPEKIKKHLEPAKGLSSRLTEVGDPLVTDLLRLVDTAPDLFTSYLWHAFNATMGRFPRKIIETELTFALFNCPVEFYKHISRLATWTRDLAEDQLKYAATLPTSDALEFILSPESDKMIHQVLSAYKSEDNVINPLHVAAHCCSNEASVRLLIEHLGVKKVTDENWTALHHAASHNPNVEITRLLIEAGADVNARDDLKWTPLHHAAQYNPNEEVVDLLIEKGARVNATDNKQWTALHHAAHYNSNAAIVKALIRRKADVHAKCDAGWTALHHAARANANEQIIQVLLENKANAKALTKRKWNALHHAAEGNPNPAVIALLIQFGAKVNEKDDIGWTPLQHAARCNSNADIAKCLIDNGAEVNTTGTRDWTPLHNASGYNSNPEVVKVLLDAGADVRAVTVTLATPVHVAAFNNPNVQVLRLLIEARGSVDAVDHENQTPLHAASSNNSNPEIIRYLIGQKSEINSADADQCTPLHNAIKRADFKSVLFLIAAGADVNAVTSTRKTPLHLVGLSSLNSDLFKYLFENVANLDDIDEGTLIAKARQYSETAEARVKIVQLLTTRGANVNATDEESQTPLHTVIFCYANRALLEQLVLAGADVDAADDMQRTPLHLAARSNQISEIIRRLSDRNLILDGLVGSKAEVINYLLTNEYQRATVDAVDQDGLTALHHATLSNSDPEVVRVLIKNNANVNAVATNKTTPLLNATFKGTRKSVELIVEAGANIHSSDDNQMTPLHYAAQCNSDAKIIKLLLHKGALIGSTDNQQRTPLHHAARWNSDPAAVQLLIAAGADLNATDDQQWTPLHHAVRYNSNIDIISTLIEAKADVNALTASSESAIQLAGQYSCEEVVALLYSAGATVDPVELALLWMKS